MMLCQRPGRRALVYFLPLLVLLFALPAVGQVYRRSPSQNVLQELSEAFRRLSESVSPAVVQILATGYSPVSEGDAGAAGLLARQRSSGSGVILDADGHLVTNAHVVEGARSIQVLLAVPTDERAQWRSILKPRGKSVPARIVGLDRETDLAVLKIDAGAVPFLQFGDSDRLRPGDLVLAFGSPLGLENSVTMGVVSSEARQLRPEDPMIYIQTDASINPGNSGGPLVDTEGRVVGINTFIFSQSGGSEGIGFAAPASIVRTVFEQIRRYGHVRRGVIGVRAQTVTPALAAGLKLYQSWGVLVGDVYPGSPAEKAGVEVGDLILTLDGKTLENARQFDVNIYQRQVGDRVTMELMRGTEKQTRRVLVVERQDDPLRFSDRIIVDRNLIAELGVFAVDLDAEILGLLPPLRKSPGVLVAALSAGDSPAAGLFLPGDVIYSLNGKQLGSLAELKAALSGLKEGDPRVLQVERQRQLLYVSVEP